jgi:hypothetical protein
MKVTLSTTSAVKQSGAEFKAFDVKASTTVEGFKITATAKPATPTLSFDPVKLNNKSPSVEVNAEVSKDGVTVFLDNLQRLSDKKFAPRVKAETHVTVSGDVYSVDAELAMKGNIKTSDVLTVSVKAPKVQGFVPKATYSTGPKGVSLSLTGDVGDANVDLKAEHFPQKSGDALEKTSFTGTVTYTLDAKQKMKAKLTVKDDLSGSVELHKGNAFLEAPLGKNGKPPKVSDVVFKFKKSFECDL